VSNVLYQQHAAIFLILCSKIPSHFTLYVDIMRNYVPWRIILKGNRWS